MAASSGAQSARRSHIVFTQGMADSDASYMSPLFLPFTPVRQDKQRLEQHTFEARNRIVFSISPFARQNQNNAHDRKQRVLSPS